jgi:hypothetical protein
VWVSNSYLRRDWELDESAALRLPAVMLQVGLPGFGFTTELCRRIASKRSVNATVIVILSERAELVLQVNGVPKQRLVKELTANGPNQALNKWMGNGRIRDALDLTSRGSRSRLFPIFRRSI